MPVPTGIDALPPSLRASVGSIGYHPGMKRSNEITLDYDSGVQVVKKAKTTFTVDLESYYYGTIEGDISVGIIFVYLIYIYMYVVDQPHDGKIFISYILYLLQLP